MSRKRTSRSIRSHKSVEERFWPKVDVRGPGDCWEWQASCYSNGYSRLFVGGKRVVPAHRVSYEINVGPIPEGFDVHHVCENKRCVNPAHLEVLTKVDHWKHHVPYKSTLTHCPKGHPYSGDNLSIEPSNGARRCRICRQHQKRAYYVNKVRSVVS